MTTQAQTGYYLGCPDCRGDRFRTYDHYHDSLELQHECLHCRALLADDDLVSYPESMSPPRLEERRRAVRARLLPAAEVA